MSNVGPRLLQKPSHDNLGLSAMQELTTVTLQASQHPDMDAAKHRKSLNDLVITFMCNVNCDSSSLTKLLHCISHCLEEFPQIFVVAPGLVQTEEFTRKKLISAAFSRWISSQLIFLTSKHQKINDCSEKCAKTLSSLLKLVKIKDAQMFLKMVTDLINFVAELQNVKGTFCSQSNENKNVEIYPLPFDPSANFEESNINHLNWIALPIVITSVEDCEQCQVIITATLTCVLNEIILTSPRLIDCLCVILCQDLSSGGACLTQSLTSIRLLLDHNQGLPRNPQIALLIVKSVIDTLKHVSSLQAVDMPNPLEVAICTCIQGIFSGYGWTTYMYLPDVPLILIQAFSSAKDGSLIQETSGSTLIQILDCCNLTGEVLQGIQSSVSILLERRCSFKLFSRLLFALIMKELAASASKHGKLHVNFGHNVAANAAVHSQQFHIETSPTWNLLVNNWKYNSRTWLEGIVGILQALHLSCQMMELLSLLQNLDVKLCVKSLFLQSVEKWNPVLKNIVSWPEKYSEEIFCVLIRYVTALQNPKEHFGKHVSYKLIGLLSLPWLGYQENHDFPDDVYKDLEMLAVKFRSCLGKDFISEAVLLLLTFPFDVCVNWRSELMKQFLNSSDPLVRKAAVHSLPLFLHYVGITHFSIVDSELRAIIGCDDVSQVEELSQNFGSIICVLCNSSKTINPVNSSVCSTFAVVCGDEHAVISDAEILEQVSMLSKLLIHHSCSSVRLAFVRNLDHILGHLMNHWKVADNCLVFLEDDIYEIRFTFSKHMNTYYACMKKMEFNFEALISRIKTAYLTAQGKGLWRVVETILVTLGYLGKLADGDLYKVIVISLVENLYSSSSLVTSIACLQLKEIARCKQLKMNDLFLRLRQPICQFLANSLSEAQKRGDVGPVEVLNVIVKVFNFTEPKSLFETMLPHLLPHLLCNIGPGTVSLINCLSKYLEENPKKILVDNFKYIFCHLVCYCSHSEMEATLKFIRRETDVEIGGLLRYDCQKMHNELLLRIESNYDRVFNGLAMLASKDDSHPSGKLIVTNDEMADFLQPKFLGFLAFFDSLMQNSSVLLEEKHLALNSMAIIIKLMGPKHITAVRMKVLTSLRIMLKFKDDTSLLICCRAWDSFIRALDIATVGPMLSQLVITILPLMINCQQEVAGTMNYLFVENRDVLQDHFHDLYFIPDAPGLLQVHAVLREYQENSPSQTDLNSLLMHSCRVVAHENVEVRLHALKNLLQLLRERQADIHALILGKDVVDPLVSKLVNMLLISCRDSDIRIRDVVGECLGEFGAIDPGRLEIKICLPQEMASQMFTEVDDDNFSIELVTVLAKAYLSAVETRIQDCASYALQEVLQIFNFLEGDSGTSSGSNLWNRLSEDVRQIASSLLHSRYVMARSSVSQNIQKPIYCSRKGKTFQDWIKSWTCYLLSKVKQEKASKIFVACSMIVRHDASTALFLLPRILVCLLQEGVQSIADEVYKEIITVLNHIPESSSQSVDLHHMSVQTVFSILDFLRNCVGRKNLQQNLNAGSNVQCAKPDGKEVISSPWQKVQEFLNRISNDVLALSSFRSQAYTRALMYMEMHVKQKNSCMQEHFSFFQKLYGALDEPDGVAGVMALSPEANLQDQILCHESTGQLQDAIACFERAIQSDTENLANHQGLLKCMMKLNQPQMALTYANGLISQRQELMSQLNPYRIEAAWKLTSWDNLESYLKCDALSVNSWSVDIGKILLLFKKKEGSRCIELLKQLRCAQITPLSAASMESGAYQRCYRFLTRLHMLNEIKKTIAAFCSSETIELEFLSEWKNRQQLVQASPRYLEPLMHLRRVLLSVAVEYGPLLSDKLEQEIGRCWLHSAKVARKCGHLQRASNYLLMANTFCLPEVLLERAKCYWLKGEQENAIQCLHKVIKEHYVNIQPVNGTEENTNINLKLAHAKTKLLLSRYTEESGNLESNAMIQMYKDVLEIYPAWEDGHFYLARYFDRILSNPNEKLDNRGELVVYVIKHFGQSLCFGCRNVYQSLPRLLYLWMEYTSVVSERARGRRGTSGSGLDHMEKYSSLINQKLIRSLIQQLPPYLFLTVVSQLVSRICHSHPDVFTHIKTILAKILASYPQQAMWMMMAMSKSSHENRAQRCKEVFNHAKTVSPKLYKFLEDAQKLTDKLLELSNKNISSSSSFSIRREVPGLVNLLENTTFSKILLPIQSSMMVKLPTGPGAHHDHEPFPQDLACIKGIQDTAEVMTSLQRPKKITFIGTDGSLYAMMCKPKDDLRKDARLMEFNSVVNKFFMRDAESRRRQLHIRTYAVVPLNEECGLIEWVPNLSTLRSILTSMYKERGTYPTSAKLKELSAARSATLQHKVDILKNKLLPLFPSVFSDYLLKAFPDPTTWYLARLSYCRTTAVMSMVGYILGLGDRHGENILFDSSCGDVIHVDYNCLFNKGESLLYPELVPFRLTHNMIDAMGPSGYEGIYRKSCETSLCVMRKQKDTLMSILRPFLYDPLLEFGQTAARASHVNADSDSGEFINETVRTHVRNIETRLEGKIKSKASKAMQSCFPLSIEGQVNHLIMEATDIKNLAQMYLGWAAYL